MTLHEKFMGLALEQARKALEKGEFPVGCVISDGRSVLAPGARNGSRQSFPNETDHAEMVALKALTDSRAAIDTRDLAIYSTLEPCLMCFGAILIHGIHTIVYGCEDAMGGGTGCDLASLPGLYRREKVTIIPGISRERSLSLLRTFFSDPENHYLKKTPLAEYILSR